MNKLAAIRYTAIGKNKTPAPKATTSRLAHTRELLPRCRESHPNIFRTLCVFAMIIKQCTAVG